MEKGRIDKNGGKYIREVMMVDDVKIQWRVYYYPKEKRMQLVQLSEGRDYHDKLYLTLPEKPLTVVPYYSIYLEDSHLHGHVKFKADSYTGKRDERFSLQAYIGSSRAELEDYEAENAAINDVMRLAFAGWNELLDSKLNISLRNLGFKSYIPIA